MPEAITEFEAIDVHAHLGLYRREGPELYQQWMSGESEIVMARARGARSAITIVSSLQALLPRGNPDVLGGNQAALKAAHSTAGLRFWSVVHPGQPDSFAQSAEFLKSDHCAGIKIHPEEHRYPIREHGRALFEFAARHSAVLLTHSGEEWSRPEDFVAFANEFPEVTLILAHLGCTWDGDPTHQVRAISDCRHANMYVDTSSAASLTPGLIEWAVAEIGSERILYGSDSPLYFAPMQRARIDHAELPDGDKKAILRENARRVLGDRLAWPG